MTAIKDFVKNWWGIFQLAALCIWQDLKGELNECPPCWKCTAARWIIFSLALFGAYLGVYYGLSH